MNLTETKLKHGIIAEKHAGGGRRWSHRSYFAHIRSPRGDKLSALDYVSRYGFDALVSHGHAAEGDSAEEAVEKLCAANGIEI